MNNGKLDLIDDLRRIDGKAEIVHGRIVRFPPLGALPAIVVLVIAFSLHRHIQNSGLPGIAVGNNGGFLTHLPHRQSFSPCAAYFEGPDSGMGFFPLAPQFALEVRNLSDYGPTSEGDRADKRCDYFTAGTLVVWDVDLLSRDVVKLYRATDPENPTVYRRGEVAEAEPAVPGWTLPVDDLFER